METITLAPGERTHTELGLVLEPRAEEPRPYSARGPLELVLRRGPDAPPERIMLSPGQAVALQASGHQLQMFPGPEGPLVLVTRAGDVPVLLGPPRVAQPPTQPSWPALELVPPTRQTIAARTEPERLLTILGVVFLVIGLLVHARVASVTVTMRARGNATEVSIRSANAPEVAERVKARLSEAAKP